MHCDRTDIADIDSEPPIRWKIQRFLDIRIEREKIQFNKNDDGRSLVQAAPRSKLIDEIFGGSQMDMPQLSSEFLVPKHQGIARKKRMAEENKVVPLKRQIELFVKFIDRDSVLPKQIARHLDPLKDSLMDGDGSEYFLEQALNAALKRWNDKRDYFQVSSMEGLSYYQNGARINKDQDLLLIDLHEMASTVGNALEWHALEYTRRNTSHRYRNEAVPQVTNLQDGSSDDVNSRRNVRSVPGFQRDEITPFNVQLETLIEIYDDSPIFRLYGKADRMLLERLQTGDETIGTDQSEEFLRGAINSAFAMTDPNVNYHHITRKFGRSGFTYRIDMANMWDRYEGRPGGGFSTLLGTAIKKPEGLHWQALEWFKRNDFASYRSAMSGLPREDFKNASPDVTIYRYDPEAASQMKNNRFPYL